MKKIKFLPLLFLIISCSKISNIITPKATADAIIGKWNFKSTSGDVTIDGKTIPYSGIDDKNNLFPIRNYQFKADNKGIANAGLKDSTEFKYMIVGKLLTIELKGVPIVPKMEITNNKQLTLTSDKLSFTALISALKKTGVNVTDMNQVSVYEKE